MRTFKFKIVEFVTGHAGTGFDKLVKNGTPREFYRIRIVYKVKRARHDKLVDVLEVKDGKLRVRDSLTGAKMGTIMKQDNELFLEAVSNFS